MTHSHSPEYDPGELKLFLQERDQLNTLLLKDGAFLSSASWIIIPQAARHREFRFLIVHKELRSAVHINLDLFREFSISDEPTWLIYDGENEDRFPLSYTAREFRKHITNALRRKAAANYYRSYFG